MENQLKIVNREEIKNLIYTIRGKQVMLDSDVAMLYNYETKNINKAMKRNIERFPEDFCFQLTKEELKKMWFQFGTTSENNNFKYRSEKYLPYVYTEQGISMLAGVLKNDIAIQVSISIIRKTDKFHDRFIVIDNKELYHCGASIKDLGKKCFGINKIDDVEIVNKFVTF